MKFVVLTCASSNEKWAQEAEDLYVQKISPFMPFEVKELKILASSSETGVYAISTNKGKQIFITGHSEYERDTLKNEYLRDKEKGLDIAVPKNYFPNDDPSKEPIVSWRAHANLLFSNWLNYFVYQETPYDLNAIPAQHAE